MEWCCSWGSILLSIYDNLDSGSCCYPNAYFCFGALKQKCSFRWAVQRVFWSINLVLRCQNCILDLGWYYVQMQVPFMKSCFLLCLFNLFSYHRVFLWSINHGVGGIWIRCRFPLGNPVSLLCLKDVQSVFISQSFLMKYHHGGGGGAFECQEGI